MEPGDLVALEAEGIKVAPTCGEPQAVEMEALLVDRPGADSAVERVPGAPLMTLHHHQLLWL